MQIVLMKVDLTSHADIWKRIHELGPEYIRDFTRWHPEHGPILVFGEVGLVIDNPPADLSCYPLTVT